MWFLWLTVAVWVMRGHRLKELTLTEGPQIAEKEGEDYGEERLVQGRQTASETDRSYHHTCRKSQLHLNIQYKKQIFIILVKLNTVKDFLLSDSVGNHQLFTLHNLLQLTQIIYVVYLSAKLKAVNQKEAEKNRLHAVRFSLTFYSIKHRIQERCEGQWISIINTEKTDLIMGLKSIRMVLINMVGWTMYKALIFFLYLQKTQQYFGLKYQVCSTL